MLKPILVLGGVAAFICMVLGILIGWILNLITLVTGYGAMELAEFALRVVGLFVVPLGGIMGWL